MYIEMHCCITNCNPDTELVAQVLSLYAHVIDFAPSISSNVVTKDGFECFLSITSYHETLLNGVLARFKGRCEGYWMASPKKFHMLFVRCQMQNKSVPNNPWERGNLGHLK